jgi:NAD(P)-dependent dehydrogenase (short-subunit alcohol dehydrogenase family)
MNGRICLVTGASSGIGKATATALARRGATVVLVCRDQARGEEARAAVVAQTRASGGTPDAPPTVELQLADLSSLAAVRTLAARVHDAHPQVDVLINCAAVYLPTRTLTVDGLETMFATNHLAPFLLTNLLLKSLRASGGGRVLTMTAPSTVRLDFDDLQDARRFRPLVAFGASKMANLLFTFALARRLERHDLEGHSVIANAVHPGLVRSTLMRQAPAVLRGLTWMMSSPPERAAAAIVQLASAPEVSGQTGRFYHNGKEIKADAYAYDPGVQQRLWDVSAALAHLDAPFA